MSQEIFFKKLVSLLVTLILVIAARKEAFGNAEIGETDETEETGKNSENSKNRNKDKNLETNLTISNTQSLFKAICISVA